MMQMEMHDTSRHDCSCCFRPEWDWSLIFVKFFFVFFFRFGPGNSGIADDITPQTSNVPMANNSGNY